MRHKDNQTAIIVKRLEYEVLELVSNGNLFQVGGGLFESLKPWLFFAYVLCSRSTSIKWTIAF